MPNLNNQPARIAYAALLAAMLSAPVLAETKTTPIMAGASEMALAGKVMVVNRDTRMMTIKSADGKFHVLHIPAAVKRIDAIKIGDQVAISEVTSVLVELQRGRDAGAMGAEGSTTVDSKPGAKPAGTITEVLTLYGKVVSVDKKAGTVTVRGAEATRTFDVQDRAMLDELKPGDGVIAKFRNTISGVVTAK